MKMSNRFAAAVASMILLSGCVGQQGAAGVAPMSPVGGGTSALLAKPLRLPKLSSATACPATPATLIHLPLASPRGGSTFYLDGQNPRGGYAFNKTVYVLVRGAWGPVLLRGGRIDGVGTLKFDGPAADPHELGETVTSDGGVMRTFYAAVISPGNVEVQGRTGDVFYLYPSRPGCYALQADGDGFENIVVLVATA